MVMKRGVVVLLVMVVGHHLQPRRATPEWPAPHLLRSQHVLQAMMVMMRSRRHHERVGVVVLAHASQHGRSLLLLLERCSSCPKVGWGLMGG